MTPPSLFRQNNNEADCTATLMKNLLSPSIILAVAKSDGTILEWNENFQQVFGYTAASIHLTDFLILNTELPAIEAWQQLLVQARLEGQWSGELCFYSEMGELLWVQATVIPFSQPGRVLLVFHDSLVRSERDYWRRQACLHELTNLPNKRAFDMNVGSYIQEADHFGRRAFFFYMDVDKFKGINDKFGHMVGDEVLKELGRRLKVITADEGMAFHFSGDEFVIVLHETDDFPDLLAAVHSVGSQPFTTSRGILDIDISVGASIYPSHSNDVTTLLEYADSAMFLAKTDRVSPMNCTPHK
ncbi:GGDEF domain-containing protein [Sporosarcina cascadiensis]|uniref:GGDEF domain-containing protein n=1 Tax=Sporosarcina cascadiensis TaxID=2660747 RepID=UPI00129A9A08|nr:GGDEF domain-containing protein [Sporosarcina cascadiensis]